jgi:hypothetical protein
MKDKNCCLRGPEGAVGPEGPQGIQGERGPEGATGPTGQQGVQGIEGPTGPQGVQGIEGPTGPQGVQGIEGPTGPQGVQGIEGPTGPTGPQGVQGIEGPTGPTGQQGVQGIEGPTGPQGVQGIEGPTGPTGQQGVQGVEGPTGPTGQQGVQGIEGPTGPTGQQGIQGPTGLKGDTGPQGPSFTTGNFQLTYDAVGVDNVGAPVTQSGTADFLWQRLGDQVTLTAASDLSIGAGYIRSVNFSDFSSATANILPSATVVQEYNFVIPTENAVDINSYAPLTTLPGSATFKFTYTPAALSPPPFASGTFDIYVNAATYPYTAAIPEKWSITYLIEQ